MIKQAERHRGGEIKFNEVKEHSRNHLFFRPPFVFSLRSFRYDCQVLTLQNRRQKIEEENPLSQWMENVYGNRVEEKLEKFFVVKIGKELRKFDLIFIN